MSPLPKAAHTRRSVTVLGSTGSIGVNTLDLLSRHEERFSVAAITAQENVELLAAQARKTRAALAVIGNEAHYAALKAALAGTGTELAAGPQAVTEAARMGDMVVSAIVGQAGLLPTLAAARRGATIALANKECLVCAGELLIAEVQKAGGTLLPVDSEHNAIFQAFDFARADAVEKIILTASGGPFRTFSAEQMKMVTPEQAVRHPRWNMGAKISVDSATMMNKGLEVIEAYHLFPLRPEQIEVLIHPESVIHGMVCYRDGSVLAQLGSPDMRTPIAHALAWPERMESPSPRLDLAALGQLTFGPPDYGRFPLLKAAREALEAGGTAPAILNAANEVAVARFLKKEVAFPAIHGIIVETMQRLPHARLTSIETALEADKHARRIAETVTC